jgi:alkylation response protein AidB-like acyl-CoA dehydrogenase
LSLVLSRRDVDFLLYEWLDAESLTARPYYAAHDRQVFDAVLDLSEDLACDLFATHNRKADAEEPHFDGERVHIIPEVKQALDAFIASGLLGAGKPASIGGMQLPTLIDKAASAFFLAANPGTYGYVGLTMAATNLLLEHGTPEQIDRFALPMLEGRFFGTMCLSEPQAGSSLSDIATRAELQPDGSFRLFGNKMWISAGEHALSETIVHLVLAKVPGGPPGVKGISLFIFPRELITDEGRIGERNDVVLAGLNHKMGHRGTTNCLLNFGEGFATPGGKAGAVGYLVGQLHNGLAGMFTMMNEARIGVGTSAAVTGYSGYLHAVDYAKIRLQGRPNGAKDPTTPQQPLVRHADIRRMLLAQKSYVEGGLAYNLYCAKLVDELRSGESEDCRTRAGLLLDLMTPIAKSWPSQWCLAANDLAIQVHGGYGYTRDYNVEQLYRDNRLNPIHEGTHGIQAVDLLGRKVVMRQGAALAHFAQLLQTSAEAARATGEAILGAYARELGSWLEHVLEVTATIHRCADVELRLANASVYLEAFGHLAIAWIWLEQATAAHGKTGDFYEGKRAAARYFYSCELPKIGPMLDLLEKLDRTTLDCDPAWF